MRARLNPILKYGGASNEKSKAPFPFPHPHPSISFSLLLSCSVRFSPLACGCVGGDRERDWKYEKKERKKEESKGRKERKWGKREGYRDEGPRCWWCKTETDSIGWRSKSIEQSHRGGGQPGQGEERRGGTSTGARAPITTLASGVQWGIKWASPGQHQRKRWD